jgi:RNA polymerase sigma factor (sigma-70 family)
MADDTDQELMRSYARSRSERAFGELVHRHVDHVYSTALRLVRDPALAEEVTQRVFVLLAQHSLKLERRSSVTGWLHTTARNIAINTIRGEERRRQREREAAAMIELDSNDSETFWRQIEAHLDEALSGLNQAERDLILLRYFERRTAGEIGVRLGVSAEAAQKRVTRALDRLRGILATRGPGPATECLADVLSTQAVHSAPVGLAASIIAATSAASAIVPATSTLQIIMASTKVKIALAAAVLVVGFTTPLVVQHQRNSHLTQELLALRQQGPELDRLREEVQRLTDEAQSSAKQRETERAELSRLRGELTALKARAVKMATAANGMPPARRPEKAPATSNEESDRFVPAEEWKNIGFQVPSSTVQTLEWAKVRGDTNVIFNALAWPDEHSRAGVEAIFAAAPESVRSKYGSADAYVLSLFNHSGPLDDRHTVTSYRVLQENISGDEAILQLEFRFGDGSSSASPMRYVRIGNDWRQALDFGAPEVGKLNTSLQAEGGEPTSARDGN